MLRLAAVFVAAFLVFTPIGRAAAADGYQAALAEVRERTADGSAAGGGGAAGSSPRRVGRLADPAPGACLSSVRGWRTLDGHRAYHDGIDLTAAHGTPIRAAAAGVVILSVTADPGGYGQYMRIRHAGGAVTEYGHMRTRLATAGDRVAAGQRIALMGAEGSSTGPHLHLRWYPDGLGKPTADPRGWLGAGGVAVRPC